jgi:phosphopantothenoylcysteine decarboxylase/phosphopantothenate--cysteine ligase
MIAANNLKESGAGFQTDTNRITLIKKDEIIPLDLMSKEEAADQILTELLHMRAAQTV